MNEYTDICIVKQNKVTFFCKAKKRSGRIYYIPVVVSMRRYLVKLIDFFVLAIYRRHDVSLNLKLMAEIQALFFRESSSMVEQNFEDLLNLAVASRTNLMTKGLLGKKKVWKKKKINARLRLFQFQEKKKSFLAQR